MKPTSAELRLVPLNQLEDHPDNPRLFTREEVVDGIAASLKEAGAYPKHYAVHARPVGEGRFQLVGGHHRKKGAIKAELTEVWAWVREMDDAEALMSLVLDNRQGELAPLEIGTHALVCLSPARGKKGHGLAVYADQLGKTKQYVGQVRDAAEVYHALVKTSLQVERLHEKAYHLHALHAAKTHLWVPLARALVQAEKESKGKDGKGSPKEPWTVERTKQVVTTVKKAWEGIPENWRGTLFPHEAVAEAVVLQKRAPTFFSTLASTAQLIADLIAENKKTLPETASVEFGTWLEENAGGLAWDVKELQAYRDRVQDMIENPLPPGVYSLLLADPPWRYDFAETDNRQIENQYPTMTLEEIKSFPEDHKDGGKIAEDAVLFLWATQPKLREALEVMEAWGFEYKTGAVWVKDRIGMGYWFRGQHELLLVGTRGNFSPPAPESRAPSVIVAARREHSEKPEEVYGILEAMLPEASRVELFQRGEPRPGWAGWGYDAKRKEACA